MCNQELALCQFNKTKSKKDGLQPFCRQCQSIRHKIWFEKNKENRKLEIKNQKKRLKKLATETVNKIKNQPCVDCKQTFNPWQMDFDHIKGKKLFNISEAAGNGTIKIETILEEVSKCEVVCSNCHRQRTYLRRIAHSSNGQD